MAIPRPAGFVGLIVLTVSKSPPPVCRQMSTFAYQRFIIVGSRKLPGRAQITSRRPR
ncbi:MULTISPECIES: hypothetical protein [unclassified Rhizobium]|jgi:hypothetical protein|uniref:hypothetical protein n=1 Tax=unclassified Rhizobium TaxID=2613769 RepID=UPI0013AF93C4|nr:MULTISPECIES: hypothetical protein [unclassified Rhizobium]MBB3290879.1 hypothetical protein [Rhizobium sp. BK252]MBB3405659.1 hypothetical protein [Rhizobium sp. BK289]MBB3418206.1 hypothetical protein [Rhizobium sp. BK284]MBB3486112.1 hypothetical protein [Rhizobium sp. BK347]